MLEPRAREVVSEMGKRVFFDHRKCCVWISIVEGGCLRLSGQDLAGAMGADEYEYWITVDPEHFGAIRVALDAPPDADIIEVMCANAEKIFMQGETTWLKSHDIPFDFANYF